MKNVCLIDLDDTLVDLKTPLMLALNRRTNKNLHWNSWDTFDLTATYNITNAEFLNICIEENVLNDAVIHDSSKKFLDDLNFLGYHTVLITARGWHPRGKNITEEWVSNHNLSINELIVVGMEQSKTDMISKFNNIVFSIDDRIKHCREYKNTNKIRHVLLYNMPWNINMTRWNPFVGGYDYDERIYDLKEIITHLDWCNEETLHANVC